VVLSRRTRWALVLAFVLALHGAAVRYLDSALVGWGGGEPPMPARIEVAFVKALSQAAPPPAATPARAPAPAVARKRRVQAVATPASAAPPPTTSEPVVAPSEPPLEQAASAPAPAVMAAASQAEVPASAPAAAASQAVAAVPAPPTPAFEWPPSTRLTYSLLGNYRGEVHGSARVQWVRAGARYQVHLDVAIGPSFAPLISRRMTSDGDLGDAGLAPRRYDESTRLPFQSARRATVQFTPGLVTLANGSVREAPADVQDTASQFVQLTWIFTTQPQRLRVGDKVEFPVALPRRVDRWVYEVMAEERLSTPVGMVDSFHLKPRRAQARPKGELAAEVWIAPTLQYLPVRIRIEQDAETYLDLLLDAAPLQAAPQGAAGTEPAR
jgi:hypothetical protein